MAATTITSRGRRHAGRRLLGLMLASCVVVAVGASQFLLLSADGSALRRTVAAGLASETSTIVQFRVAPAILAPAWAGLTLIDRPPEARLALRSVCRARVGVDQLSARPSVTQATTSCPLGSGRGKPQLPSSGGRG